MWKKQREKNKFQWLEQDSTHDHFDPSAVLYQLSNFALCSVLSKENREKMARTEYTEED